jgi:hypothetical protein
MYQQQQQQQQVQQAHAMAAQAQSNPLFAAYNPAAIFATANPEVGSFFLRFCWMWLSWSFPNFSLPIPV